MSDVPRRLNAVLQGHYRVERQLGEDRMATVYLAKDLKHNRNVALKVLRPQLAAVVGGRRFPRGNRHHGEPPASPHLASVRFR